VRPTIVFSISPLSTVARAEVTIEPAAIALTRTTGAKSWTISRVRKEILLEGEIGMTSDMADLLRQAEIPSRKEQAQR